MQPMKRVRWLKFACLLLLGTMWHVGALRADDKVTSDRRLPKDTFFYVSVPNVPEFSKQFGKTGMGQLLKDKALADFWKEIHGKISEKQKEVETAIGTEFSELPGLAQGEVSFALTKAGSHGLALVIFFHYGEKQELVNKLIEKAEKALAEEGVKRVEEDLTDAKAVILKDDDDDPNNPVKSFSYMHKDKTLVIATDIEALKLVLSRWDGQHEQTLAKNDVYKYIADHSKDDQQTDRPGLTWYIDAVGAFRSYASSPKANPQIAMGMMFLPLVGLDKVRGWGGRVEFPGVEFDTVSRSLLYLDTPAAGITNLLQFDPEAQAPPKWVRSDVSAYAAFNWDVQKAIAGVESLVDLRGPGTMAKFIDQLAQRDPKVHLRKDLLDHFTGHFHVVGKPGEGKGVKAAQTRALLAFELKDAAAVKRTVTKVMATAPPSVKNREFEGETIYEMQLPNAKVGGDDDQGAPMSAGLVISNNMLMFSNDVTLIENALRSKSDQETLADSEAYKKISKKFPAKTTSIAFSRQDAQVRAVYELLRAGTLSKEMGDAVDFSKLPEFSALQKYFTPSGGYTIPDEHGLKSITFSLPSSEN